MGTAVSQNHIACVDVHRAIPAGIVCYSELGDEPEDGRRATALSISSKHISICGQMRRRSLRRGPCAERVTDGRILQRAQARRRNGEIAGWLF